MLQIGIIGTGGIARSTHMTGYRAQKDAEVVAVCDIIPGRAEAFASDFGIPRAYESYQAMLASEKLDAVSVCTPNYAHRDATIAALEAGAHVLCEKPIAMNADEGREMVAAAHRAHKTLQIGLHWRFHSEAQLLKRMIDAGELGEIYYGEATCLRRRGIPSWGVFTQKELQGGGALIDIGVHTLDHTMWLMGNPRPVSVMGATYQKFGKRKDVVNPWGKWDTAKFNVDDLGIGMVRFDNGASLIVRASWAANIEKEFSETRILGTEGGAYLKPLKIFKEMHQALVDITPTHLPESKPAVDEITHFLACVRGECDCLVVPEQVVDVQAVLDAIYKSSETGHEVIL